jgi:hypothetical protein
MATRKRTIKSRKEKISQRRTSVKAKGKQIGKKFREEVLPNLVGGTISKGAKTIKEAANLMKIKRAKIKAKAKAVKRKDAGKERIKRSEKGIRATTKRKADPAKKKRIADAFDFLNKK